jgi:hypothetical protein
MHRVVQSRIRPHPTLEVSGRTVDLAEKLHLQPTLAGLDDVKGWLGPGEFRDAEQAYLPHQIDQALWHADDRADLSDGLKTAPVDRGHAG